MKVVINTSRLPTHLRTHRYLVDGYCIDYLGQILIQRGYDIPEKTRFPSELKTLIPPFTCPLRGIIVDTILTLRILQLDRVNLNVRNDKFEELMNDSNISVQWINEQQFSHPVGKPIYLSDLEDE